MASCMSALATIEQLKKLGLARGIYPLLDLVVERADTPFVQAALADTDRRVNEGKPVAPSFLLATALWAWTGLYAAKFPARRSVTGSPQRLWRVR